MGERYSFIILFPSFPIFLLLPLIVQEISSYSFLSHYLQENTRVGTRNGGRYGFFSPLPLISPLYLTATDGRGMICFYSFPLQLLIKNTLVDTRNGGNIPRFCSSPQFPSFAPATIQFRNYLLQLIDHRRSINCAIKQTCTIKYQAEIDSINTILQVINIAHTRSI